MNLFRRTLGREIGLFTCILCIFSIPIIAFAQDLTPTPTQMNEEHQHHEGMEMPSSDEEHHHHEGMEMTSANAPSPTPDPSVKVEEKLGSYIPLDAQFTNEDGKTLALKDLLDKPALLVPIFYYCTNSCSLMLGNLATISAELKDVGKEFNILTFSINEEETPEFAQKRKSNYLNLVDKDFAKSSWYFLTGTKDNIYKVTDSLGFYFKKVGKNNFAHPNVMIAIGKDGKIIRYLHGVSVLPADINMAMLEAERGTPELSVRKFLSYCLSYNPETKTYSLKFLYIFGYIISGFIGLFIVWIAFGKRKNKNKD